MKTISTPIAAIVSHYHFVQVFLQLSIIAPRDHANIFIGANRLLKLARISNVEDDGDEEHQHTIENVQCPFVRQWISVISHQIFDNTKY